MIIRFLLNLILLGSLWRIYRRGVLSCDVKARVTFTHSVFSVISPTVWHSRLGHPGNVIFNYLRSNHFIACNNARDSSCPSLGKSVKLPFYDSLCFTTTPFDIVQSNLWTSSIVSSSGHKYYVIFLDNYTNFLWTFPLAKKSQVFYLFLKFNAFIKTQIERDIKKF